MSTSELPYGLTPTEAASYVASQKAAREAALKNGFEECTFVELRVFWGDQDPNMHVNNVRFFKWLEAGRITFLYYISTLFPNVSQETLSDFTASAVDGRGYVLSAVSNTYLKPVVAPDSVLVAHRVKGYTEKKLILESFVYSYGQRAVVARGEATMARFDFRKGKSVPLQDDMKKEVEKKLKAVAKL